MKFFAAMLVLATSVSLFSQGTTNQTFLIDPSKPYVFLEFDHLGNRKPIEQDESNIGIWLRVVNNCSLPIILTGFDGSPGEPGVVLLDEVVDNEPVLEIIASSPKILTSTEAADDAQSRSDDSNRDLRAKEAKKPHGYIAELPGVYRVLPGTDLLFSIPRNHVSDKWYMRVSFTFDLDKSSLARGPFTYLPFRECDIPKARR